jgi:hypothetical protein
MSSTERGAPSTVSRQAADDAVTGVEAIKCTRPMLSAVVADESLSVIDRLECGLASPGCNVEVR